MKIICCKVYVRCTRSIFDHLISRDDPNKLLGLATLLLSQKGSSLQLGCLGFWKGSCIFCSSYCPLPFTSLNLKLHNQLGLLVWVLPQNSQSMQKIEDRTQACMHTESRDARNGPYFMASPWEQRKEGATVVSATWVWPVLIGTWLGFEMVYAGLTPHALLYFWNMYSTRDLLQTASSSDIQFFHFLVCLPCPSQWSVHQPYQSFKSSGTFWFACSRFST